MPIQSPIVQTGRAVTTNVRLAQKLLEIAVNLLNLGHSAPIDAERLMDAYSVVFEEINRGNIDPYWVDALHADLEAALGRKGTAP